MDVLALVFNLLGGLGLFIYGMKLMGEGLQKTAGHSLKTILSRLTNNRVLGLGVGTFITSIIQSSTATSVMVIGFVNAGLMSLIQAIPIMFGANIGTTMTAQLIAFKVTDYALPIIAFGVALLFLGRHKKINELGVAILGFGILFFGLNLMATGVQPLSESLVIQKAFTDLGENVLLGILVGIIATVILQSSSVTTGMILAFASSGLLDLSAAMPLVLGAHIGTTSTAVLVSIGGTLSAKRTALSHVLFNVIGTLIALPLIPAFTWLVTSSTGDLLRQIANYHSFVHIFNALIFIWFVPAYGKLIERLIPGHDETLERGPKYIHKDLLNSPALAVEAVHKEIVRVLSLVTEMTAQATHAFLNKSRIDVKNVTRTEDVVDELYEEVTEYLVKITEKEISSREAIMLPSLLKGITDMERIGDLAVNIAQTAEQSIEYNVGL